LGKPDDFDGATIVKDLDVPGIDLDALHDYHYGVCNAGVNLKMKWQADWLLAKEENEKAKVLTVLTASLLGLL
jgi:hypothetical protein